MISQKCPKCRSKRVRRGYRKTPFLMKLLFRYHLLCDNCNWEFAGFAVPGTVSAKPKRSKSKDENKVTSRQIVRKNAVKDKVKKKKVRIKFN